MAFNSVDLCVIAIVGLSVVISLWRGFVREALSLVTWVVSVWLGIEYAASTRTLFVGLVSNAHLQLIAGFLTVFLVVLISGTIINFLISKVIHKTGLSGTDRLLGSLFGFTRGVMIVAVMFVVVDGTQLKQTTSWKQAQLMPHFRPVAAWLQHFLPEKDEQTKES